MMGIVLDRPFPTFPDGFPREVIDAFERRIGRGTLGNVVASGTEIIDRLGPEHMRTGKPIVYTSADSVFQVAAHEDVVPLAELHAACETARRLLVAPHDVSRVIARPFTGEPGAWRRTANRRDYSIEPPGETVLDALAAAGVPRHGVGKVDDLFAGRGIAAEHTADNRAGLAAIERWRADLASLDGVELIAPFEHFRHGVETRLIAPVNGDTLIPVLPVGGEIIIDRHFSHPTKRAGLVSAHRRRRRPAMARESKRARARAVLAITRPAIGAGRSLRCLWRRSDVELARNGWRRLSMMLEM